MATTHEQIDELLAADLHDELTAAERDEFHAHLVECAECRQAFQEGKNMNRILNETMADKKADTAFEQRMVSRFRDGVPKRAGLISLITDLMRMRAVQLTAAAAILLALAQTGKMITGESATPRERRENPVALEEYRSDQDKPGANRDTGVFAKTDERTKTLNRVTSAPPPAPPMDAVTAPKPQTEALRAAGLTKTKKTEFKDEKTTTSAAEVNAETPSEPAASPSSVGPMANRKLIRNATAELEVVSFDESIQKITAFASEEKGYVATTSSEKQANGKLRGEIVVKVLPDNLDRFLGKLRGIGDLKNQALTTEDVTKAYFDTESRLKNARLMEQRLIEILKTKSKDVADLLEVEKELGRVREQIETMQGELKFMDSQVAFATVTITLAEKNMNLPAAFLLKEKAQLSLYATEVEKTYNDIKALASPKVQITTAQIDRDNTGRVSARLSLLLAPEESEAVIAKIKGMARVENFQVHDRTRLAGRRRPGRKCEDGTRQGGAEHHAVARRTGNGVAANFAAHPDAGGERQDQTAPRHRRATGRPDPQLVVLARSERARILDRVVARADEELQRADAGAERARQSGKRQRAPRRSAELADR